MRKHNVFNAGSGLWGAFIKACDSASFVKGVPAGLPASKKLCFRTQSSPYRQIGGAAGGKVVPPPTSQGMEKQLQPGSGASAKHNENISTHTRGCEEDFELHLQLTTDLAWN